jgi:hypothetical protein
VARAGNRQSSIYLGKDGHWHGRVTVGRKDDGSEDRRHVMSKSKASVGLTAIGLVSHSRRHAPGYASSQPADVTA